MSWPEAPRPAHQDPSWPEPPRNDDSWPEPPRHSRPEPARHEASGPSSWPDLPPAASSWPDPSPQSASAPSSWDARSASGPSSWDAPPPGSTEPSLWPDMPQQGGTGPSSSPLDAPQKGNGPQQGNRPSSWQDASPQDSLGTPAWPEAPRRNAGPPDVPTSWPESSQQDVPTSWPQASGPSSWPDASPQAPMEPAGRAGDHPPVPDPVPAWAQPPASSSDSWSNLSSPAPWPPAERNAADAPEERTAMYQIDDLPQGAHAPPQAHPAEERTVTYAQHSENLLNDRAAPIMDSSNSSTTPPAEDQNGPRPGSNLSRDPSDPDRPFVTAGQISGSRTPPPERQQELWNTVFGDDYQAMGEQDSLDEGQGKPIWIYALGGSVAIALVAALLWAFLAGPLASDEPASNAVAEAPTTPPKSSPTRSSTSIGALPKFSGKAAPVIGRVPDAGAGVSLPRLGGTWRLDQRATVKTTYGYDTRQYVQVAPEKYAQVMSGPLAQKLATYYQKDNLEPVIRQVVLDARKRFFPTGNKVKKIAQQPIKVGNSTGRLIAYSLTSPTEEATIVTMAVNTGGNVPAIVYMSIPADSKQLMPDIHTVKNQLRLGTQG
ncbi:hypothetical protein [Nonomuraea helvata]|uniref:Uncharacterized protein n=1 Tax=Nonomuraea helvata TaxID=37484 RepID=A0ABV5S2R8_9ACTN